jgi:hypothetical protein
MAHKAKTGHTWSWTKPKQLYPQTYSEQDVAALIEVYRKQWEVALAVHRALFSSETDPIKNSFEKEVMTVLLEKIFTPAFYVIGEKHE